MIRDFLQDLPGAPAGVRRPALGQPDLAGPHQGRRRHPAEAAIGYSLTGACLRGSGVNYDIRKAMPYCVYDRLDFEVPLGQHGDVYDRYLVRMEEMRQAIRIIGQASTSASGWTRPLMAYESAYVIPPHKGTMTTAEDMQRHFIWVIKGFSPPVGEVYVAVEHPKGEIGYYIVSDGSPLPYRFRIRAPDFVNLQRPAAHGPGRDAGRRRRPDRHDRHRAGIGRPVTKEKPQMSSASQSQVHLASSADERVVLPCVSWETYERLLADDEERRVPRMTYDQGVLELVTPIDCRTRRTR